MRRTTHALLLLIVLLGAVYTPAASAAFPTTAILDDFNRADGAVSGTASSSGAIWSTTRIELAGANSLRAVGSRGGVIGPAVQNGYLTQAYGPDVDVLVDVPILPLNGRYVALFSRAQAPGGAAADYYGLVYTHDTGGNSSWSLRRYDNTTPTVLATLSGVNLLPGDALGLRVTGTGATVDVTAYRRNAGTWSAVTSASDSSGSRIVAAGPVGLEVDDTTTRVDNFGGGTVLDAPSSGGTALSTGGCTSPAALAFPAILGSGAAVTSADCTLTFGSTDGTAQLRLRQADRTGAAMWRVTSGDADNAFDGDGVRSQNLTVDNDVPRRAIALPDGSTIVVGAQGSPATPFALQLSAGGAPVGSFGVAGVATWDVPGGAPDVAYDVARQADGKLVVVGSSGSDIAISRLLADGTPDPSFSGDGHVRIDLGGVSDQATGVAIRPGGRIVVAGTGTMTGGFALQLLADGTRDREGFAGAVGGLATSAIGAQLSVNDLALLHDGRVVLVGTSAATSDTYTTRFSTSGTLDAGFGVLDHGASAATGAAAVAQPDGKVLIASSDASRAYVSRYDRAGALDASFGTGGVATIDPTSGTESITGIDIDALGNVYATVRVSNGGSLIDGGVVRLRSTGISDTTFDGDGWRPWAIDATDPDQFNDVAVSASGSVTLAGTRRLGAGPDWELVTARMATSTVGDYGTGGTWASGSMFGACLRAVGGTGVAATWTPNSTCPSTDGAYWNAIPSGTTGGEVASSSTAGVIDASASMRFGVRSDGSLQGGAYVAPITVEVLSPNLSAPANTLVPAISGVTTTRKLLSATSGTWTGSATISYAYQWRRCDAVGASCADIAGATAATYLLAPADATFTIRVSVTATNTEGSATATSAQSAVIATAPAAGVSYLTGFEHRTASALGGGISVGINPNPGGTATPDTTIVHSGNSAMRFDAVPPGGQYQWDVDLPLATQRSATARVYVNLQSYPIGGVSFTQLEGTVAADLYCEIMMDGSGQVAGQIYRGSNGGYGWQGGPVLELNRWYMIEYTCDASNPTHTLDWRVDGQPQAQVTANGGAADWIEGFQIGIDADTTWSLVLDDVAVSRNIADYPLGPAKTIGYTPNGIGTITTPAQWQWSVNDGAAPTVFGAGDANQSPGLSTLIDEWPVTIGAAADLIEQRANFATLDVNFANTAETVPPTAISLVGAQREKVTGPNSSQVYGVSGASQLAWSRNWTGGSTAMNYLTAAFPLAPGGTSWTTAKLDAFQAQLSGSDAVPETYTDALLVEAEFPVGEVAQSTGLPTILGASKVGAPLLATTGTWTPNPTAYAYQWRRCDAAGAACVDVGGATSSTYVPVALDAAGTLRVRVTAATPAGNQSAASPPSTIIAPGSPTLTYLTGFETGTISTSGAGLFDTMSGASASSDVARNGRYGVRVASDGVTEGYVMKLVSGSPNRIVQRFAIMFEELPVGTVEISEIDVATGGNCELVYDGAGRLGARIGAAVTPSSMSIQANRWYVVDVRCDASAATRRLDWMIDGVPQTQVTRANAADVIQGSLLGIEGTGVGAPAIIRYDDWAMSSTVADYPIGAGKVVGLKPNGTLTHATPASFETSTDGAATWAPLSAADANQLPGSASLLDDWPIQYVAGTSGDLVRQVATAGQLDYALEDPEETGAVNAVRVVGSHSAGTPANIQNVEVRARLGAGTTTPYSNEVPAGATSYLAGTMTTRPGGGAWTGPDLDALYLELDSTNVGGAGDRPWTHALLAEADVPVGAMPTNVTPPAVSVPWDVPKVGDELRADDGTWSGTAVLGHRYAWLRCSAAGIACAAISGETGPTYTLQAGDAGARIRVVDFAISRAGAQGARSSATELVSTQPTPWYLTGFEHGTSSASGLGLVTQVDAATSMDTAIVRSGSYAMRSNSTGIGSEWEQDTPSITTIAVARYSVYLDTLPSGTSTMLEFTAGGGRAARLKVTPAGVAQADFYDGVSNQAVQSGATLQTGRWYQIDARVDGTTTNWRLEWRIDGAPQPTTTYTQAATAAFNQYDLGDGNNTTWLAHYDDVVYSATETDFPLGAARISPLVVDALGTGGTPGNFGPAPATSWAAALAEVPMSATSTFIEQTAITSSLTDHVPFTATNPTSSQDAFAVRGIAGYGFSAAGTNNVAIRVRRPGDTLAASPSVFNGNAEVAALSFAGAMIPAPTGGWTPTALGATDWVVGFSTDVAPTPRVHGLLLETAYRG